MHKLIQSKIETITPKRAETLLAYNSHGAQRHLSPRHVAFLARKIRTGLFRIGSVALAEGAGEKRLMNGQHQLNAVILTGHPIKVTFESYTVESEADFSLLFRQFDPSITTRTQSDMNKIEAVSLGVEWAPRVVGLVVSGASINSGKYTNSTSEDRVELLQPHLKVGKFINQILSRDPCHHLWKKAVVAVMMRTWSTAPLEADLFWTNVRDGENLRKSMPEYHLREFLLLHRSRENGAGKDIASDHEYMHRSLTCWNAFRAKRSMKILRYLPDAEIPKVQ